MRRRPSPEWHLLADRLPEGCARDGHGGGRQNVRGAGPLKPGMRLGIRALNEEVRRSSWEDRWLGRTPATPRAPRLGWLAPADAAHGSRPSSPRTYPLLRV